MSLRGLTGVAVILAILQAVAPQRCGAPTGNVIKRLTDDSDGEVVSVTGLTGVTGASLTGHNSTDNLDASLYVKVSYESDSITFTALPTIVGILDWPSPKAASTLKGQCSVSCGKDSATFDVTFLILDANTATPHMSKPSYSLTVAENYPTGVPLALNISATDADLDTENNRLTFGSSFSTFSLTPPVKNRDNPATYSTFLTLTSSLDFATKSSYIFTVTALDPGGRTAKSHINVTVKDVDNRQPEFLDKFYTASLLDVKAVGPVSVRPRAIQATDPDTGGPLKYSLVTSDAVWNQYLRLDPDKGTLRLVKEIPDSQERPEELSFTVVAKESAGPFSCQTTLRIQMKSAPGTIDNTNATGYIVGIAVLAVLLVIAVIAAAVIVRRARNRSNSGNSDRQALVYNSEDPARSKPSPLAVFSYEGEASHQSSLMTERQQSAQQNPPTIEPTQTQQTSIQDSVEKLTSELQPMRKHPEFRPPTPPPTRSKTSSISSTLPPITETDSAPASPTQPIGSESPDEPTPDYSLKSVGFKDTVECVTIEGVKDEELQDEKDAEDAEELMQANLDEAELASDDGEDNESTSETKHDEHLDYDEAPTGKEERETLDQDAEDPPHGIHADDHQSATEEGKETASEEATAEDSMAVKKSVEVELTGDEDEETTGM